MRLLRVAFQLVLASCGGQPSGVSKLVLRTLVTRLPLPARLMIRLVSFPRPRPDRDLYDDLLRPMDARLLRTSVRDVVRLVQVVMA